MKGLEARVGYRVEGGDREGPEHWTRGPPGQGSNPSAAASQPCDLGQLTLPQLLHINTGVRGPPWRSCEQAIHWI